jgi:hypothetical protein
MNKIGYEHLQKIDKDHRRLVSPITWQNDCHTDNDGSDWTKTVNTSKLLSQYSV